MGYIKLQKGDPEGSGKAINDYDLVCADNIGDMKLDQQGSIKIAYLSQVQVEVKTCGDCSDMTTESLKVMKEAVDVMNGASGPAPLVLLPIGNGNVGIESTTMTVLPVPAAPALGGN
tara:strand:- start:5499 stop:5849 length:351 start_codon:yes stop_codon:yes gene_type:complete